MADKFLVILIVTSYVSSPVSSAYSATNATSLQSDLLSGYSSKVRPSDTTVVDISFGLMHITDLNNVNQQLHVVGFVLATWTDSRLTWTPSDYGDMTSTYMLLSDIWSPPLLLNNAADEIQVMNDDSDLSSVNVYLSSNGQVIWLAPANFRAQCTINIMYYPFDSQKCSFVISSWIFVVSDVQIGGSESSINMDLYEENGEWDLKGSAVENKTRVLLGNPLPAVQFITYLSRKYSYYLMNMVMPVIVLAVMEPFVFMLPVESGEKIGYALTILLSLSVVMTLVSDSIPPTSTPVCILSVYLLTTFIICAFETLLTVLTCRIHDFKLKGFTPGPKLQTITRILAKITFSTTGEKEENMNIATQNNNSQKVKEIKMKENTQLSTKDKKRKAWSGESNDEQESKDARKYSYEEMAVLLDKFNFFTFILVTAIVTLVFLAILTTGLTGHSWYGFSLTMNSGSRNITGKMRGGLLFFSPLEICETTNETLCKTAKQFSVDEGRTSTELNEKFLQTLFILRSLVIAGIAASTCGCSLLYMYLWAPKKHSTLVYTGTASAVAWMLTALPEFIAVGVQIYVNMNIKELAEAVPGHVQNPNDLQYDATFITPWDTTIIGVGAILAFVVGAIIFMTTLDKGGEDTAIRFRKTSGETEVEILRATDDNTDDDEEEEI